MHTFLSMSGQIAPSALLLFVVSFASTAAAQSDTFKRPCSLDGQTVEVAVAPIHNIPQRCYEVAYHDQKNYVCVWAQGTPDGPYIFSSDFDPKYVTKGGWTGGGNARLTADAAFAGACRSAVRRYAVEQKKRRFDPDKAAKALDEFFGSGYSPESPKVVE